MAERKRITGTVYRVAGPPRWASGGRGRVTLFDHVLMDKVLASMSGEEAVRRGLRDPDLIVLWADFPATYNRGGRTIEMEHRHQYRWKTKRYPEAILAAPAGARASMLATLTPFPNGMGHYLTRCTDIRVTEEVPTDG
jgi:hypothetical protein